MSYRKVCRILSKIPSCAFYGMDPKEMPRHIKKNDAFVCLKDFIIINVRLKSDLYKIAQESGESKSQQSEVS